MFLHSIICLRAYLYQSVLEGSKSWSFEVIPFFLSRKSFNTKWFLFRLNLPDDVPAAFCSVWWYFLFLTALSVASQTPLYPIIFQHKENITSPLWFTYANNFIDKYINSLSFSTALAIFPHAQLGPVNLRQGWCASQPDFQSHYVGWDCKLKPSSMVSVTLSAPLCYFWRAIHDLLQTSLTSNSSHGSFLICEPINLLM